MWSGKGVGIEVDRQIGGGGEGKRWARKGKKWGGGIQGEEVVGRGKVGDEEGLESSLNGWGIRRKEGDRAIDKEEGGVLLCIK